MIDDGQFDELLRNADKLRNPSVEPASTVAARVRRACARRARRRILIARSGLTAAAYIAGLATIWGWQSATTAETVTTSTPADVKTSTIGSTLSKPERVDAKRQVVVRIASAYRRLRRLGDEYLYDRGDVATAMELYRRALEDATPAEQAISLREDSWLLRSLKEDRLVSNDQFKKENAL